MRWSDVHNGGRAEEERAHVCAAAGIDIPARLVSLDRWILDADASRWLERRDGSWFPAHRVYRPTGTDLVVFDLDGLDARDTTPDPDAVTSILRTFAGSELAPVSIVATSTTGLQVVARIPGWCAEPERLHHDLRVRLLLARIGSRLVEAVGRGGLCDRSGWAPGRYVRRPGWRTKDGRAVRARLWWAEP